VKRILTVAFVALLAAFGVAWGADAAAAAAPSVMDTINLLLANPLARGLMLFAGAQLLTRNEGFVKKAVPFVLFVASTLVSLVQAFFPALVPAAHAAAAAAVSAPHAPWWAVVANTVAATAIAVGLHSGPKNHREWAELGFQLWKDVERKR